MTTNHILALFLAVIALGALINDAFGHDHYGEWKMPDNPSVSCCNMQDCRPVAASMDMDGHWTARVDGRPVPIPAHKIMKGPSPDGRSHWCGQNGTTYCFMPGEVRS